MRFGLMYEIGMPKPWYEGQETARVVFNVALPNRPTQVTCVDYDSRTPLEAELVDVERSSTRDWARYTAATLRFVKPEQRGKSFRWRAYTEA